MGVWAHHCNVDRILCKPAPLDSSLTFCLMMRLLSLICLGHECLREDAMAFGTAIQDEIN